MVCLPIELDLLPPGSSWNPVENVRNDPLSPQNDVCDKYDKNDENDKYNGISNGNTSVVDSKYVFVSLEII